MTRGLNAVGDDVRWIRATVVFVVERMGTPLLHVIDVEPPQAARAER